MDRLQLATVEDVRLSKLPAPEILCLLDLCHDAGLGRYLACVRDGPQQDYTSTLSASSAAAFLCASVMGHNKVWETLWFMVRRVSEESVTALFPLPGMLIHDDAGIHAGNELQTQSDSSFKRGHTVMPSDGVVSGVRAGNPN